MSANGAAPRARRFRSLEEYWSAKLANTTQPEQGEYQDDTFPTTSEGLLILVDDVIAAFQNQDDIIEETENRYVRFCRYLTYEQAEMKAWDTIVETQKAQVEGSSHPDVVSVEFPDFITSWKFVVAYFKTSKAAVYNIFRPSFMERFVNNPATELDMKLSKKMSNALKALRETIGNAVQKHKTANYNELTGKLKDGNGNLLEVLSKPDRRQLADAVGADLVEYAKVKRAPRPTQANRASSAVQPDNQNHTQAHFLPVDHDHGADAVGHGAGDPGQPQDISGNLPVGGHVQHGNRAPHAFHLHGSIHQNRSQPDHGAPPQKRQKHKHSNNDDQKLAPGPDMDHQVVAQNPRSRAIGSGYNARPSGQFAEGSVTPLHHLHEHPEDGDEPWLPADLSRIGTQHEADLHPQKPQGMDNVDNASPVGQYGINLSALFNNEVYGHQSHGGYRADQMLARLPSGGQGLVEGAGAGAPEHNRLDNGFNHLHAIHDNMNELAYIDWGDDQFLQELPNGGNEAVAANAPQYDAAIPHHNHNGRQSDQYGNVPPIRAPDGNVASHSNGSQLMQNNAPFNQYSLMVNPDMVPTLGEHDYDF